MKTFQIVLLGLGFVFFACLIVRVGPHELWQELSLLGWGLIPIVLSEGLAEMIHSLGWRQCLSGPLRSLSWWSLFRIRLSGYAINYLTPTAALGGEVTKGTLLASHHRGPEAASGVLVGKLCFALGQLIFVALGAILIFRWVPMPRSLWTVMVASGSLVAAGIVAFFLLQRFGRLGGIVRWLANRRFAGETLCRLARELTAVDQCLRDFYRERPAGLPLAIGWHLIGYSIGIAPTWLFFHLLAQSATWKVVLCTWFLGMWFDLLTFAVPQNLGTLEGTRVVILQTLGYTSLMGVTYGFAFRLAQLFWSCVGLIMCAWLVADCPLYKEIPSGTQEERSSVSQI